MNSLVGPGRVILYGAVLLIVGEAALRLPSSGDAGASGPRRAFAFPAWSAVAVALIALVFAQLHELDMGYASDAVTAVIARTTWGHAWLVAVVVTACGLGATILRVSPYLRFTVALALCVALGGLGHAAADDRWPMLSRAADALHVAGAGMWIGSLFVVWRWTRHDQESSAMHVWSPFSRNALFAAGMVVASGAISSVLRVGQVSELVTSAYGRVLLGKVALVLVLLVTGALNRRRLESARVPLGRLVRAEMLTALLVVFFTAWLTTTAQPGE